jgi:hypothetical protein
MQYKQEYLALDDTDVSINQPNISLFHLLVAPIMNPKPSESKKAK